MEEADGVNETPDRAPGRANEELLVNKCYVHGWFSNDHETRF